MSIESTKQPEWEYKVDIYPSEVYNASPKSLESHMNALGKEGWRLVNVVGYKLIFIRRKNPHIQYFDDGNSIDRPCEHGQVLDS